MVLNQSSVRVIAHLARRFESRLGEDGISLPQYRVLSFLSEGEWAASALADHLAVSRPSVTAVVDGLVEREWVERRESPDDRRRVIHHLTAAGVERLASASAALGESVDDLFGQLDPGERARAEDGLALLGVAMLRRRDAVVRGSAP